ncbi:MAG: ABC transporter substrate-binding protein, partial [Candidatus Aminicenantes bacterium]|nr:ABC transporter substrate-binding protein [Candidatus Aminicenantes bacterium]
MIIKKTQAVFLIFVLAVPVFGIQNKIIIDDLGYSHVIDSPPKRIISLAPNITEILFALGLGEKVVGVTRYCDYPREAKQKEKIGGMTNPSLEKIIALNPDLIVGFQGNTLRILERLRSLHLPVFAIEMGKTIESVFLIINTIGAITQKE